MPSSGKKEEAEEGSESSVSPSGIAASTDDDVVDVKYNTTLKEDEEDDDEDKRTNSTATTTSTTPTVIPTTTTTTNNNNKEQSQQQQHHASNFSSTSSTCLDTLMQHIATEAETFGQLPHKGQCKLQARHALTDFTPSSTSTLFHRIGRVVCYVNANHFPRKEFWEAWTVAQGIWTHFFLHNPQNKITRIADIGAGHGLLSWMILVLHWEHYHTHQDEEPQQYDKSQESFIATTTTPTPLLSAVCIDKRIPKAAEGLAKQMIHEWPALQGQWDYVQGKLEGITMNHQIST
jgi:hypothetical protein